MSKFPCPPSCSTAHRCRPPNAHDGEVVAIDLLRRFDGSLALLLRNDAPDEAGSLLVFGVVTGAEGTVFLGERLCSGELLEQEAGELT